MKVSEYETVRLKSGHVATIVEVLGNGAAYIAEVFRPEAERMLDIEDVFPDDVAEILPFSPHNTAYGLYARAIGLFEAIESGEYDREMAAAI